MTALNRRQFVTAAAAAGVALTGASPARAQTTTKFTIISHRVHQQTLTEGPSGNVIKGLSARTPPVRLPTGPEPPPGCSAPR